MKTHLDCPKCKASIECEDISDFDVICPECNTSLSTDYSLNEELDEILTLYVKEPDSVDGMLDWRETQY